MPPAAGGGDGARSDGAGDCPDDAVVECHASGDPVSESAARHMGECGACRERVRQARENASFVDRLRGIAMTELGPRGAPRIPGYRSVGIVSSGAQGVVYKAVQESTSRVVAIKTLVAGEAPTPRQRLRAEREAEIAARLRHPNIVTVFESRTLGDGRIAVVMEFIDGVPLDAWTPPAGAGAANRPSAPARARHEAVLRPFIAVCSAIHYAHLNGVIHRDLKPDNVLVTADGRPVVLDFGIAKTMGIGATMTGEFAGTPAYASPEQAGGKPDEVDALTDVYSLGVILYRLLTGRMPYDLEGSILEIARTIAEVAPTPPRSVDPQIHPDLEAVVLRAMAKQKALRYQSTASLARDLERYLAGDPVDARAGSGWYLLRKAIAVNRRRLGVVGAAAGVLVIAAAAVGVSASRAAESARRAAQQRDQARQENIRARAVTELFREALRNTETARLIGGPAGSGNVGAGEFVSSGLGNLYYRLETGAFADEPELDQQLRRLWGSVYSGFAGGRGTELIEYAEVSLRNGLVRLRSEHGPVHPQVAASLHQLAEVLLVRHREAEARTTAREALAMRERLLGASSPDAAQTRALLARIECALGHVDLAEKEADASLAVFRTLDDGGPDPATSTTLALKGRLRLQSPTPATAEEPIREALARRMHRLPADDPAVLESLADAAEFAERVPGSGLSQQLGRVWGGSGAELARAIRADVPRIGAINRSTTMHFVRGDRTAAIQRVVRLYRELWGENDPGEVGLLIALIRAAGAELNLDVKIEATLHAADILTKRFGPTDLSVLTCLEDAATSAAYANRPGDAAAYTRRICDAWDAMPRGVADPMAAANSRRRLGYFLLLDGRHAEALPVCRRAVDEFVAVLGPDHHVVALAESALALAMLHTGDRAGADELSARALSMALRRTTTASDQLANIAFVRGHVACALGRWSEAGAMLREVWEPLFRKSGDLPWRRVLIEDMVEIATHSGTASEAARWRTELGRDPTEELIDHAAAVADEQPEAWTPRAFHWPR